MIELIALLSRNAAGGGIDDGTDADRFATACFGAVAVDGASTLSVSENVDFVDGSCGVVLVVAVCGCGCCCCCDGEVLSAAIGVVVGRGAVFAKPFATPSLNRRSLPGRGKRRLIRAFDRGDDVL